MELIVIRGGGDLATGVAQKFFRAGFFVVILETEAPTAIRRSVALSEAVYDGFSRVEDVACRRVKAPRDFDRCRRENTVPLLVDPNGGMIAALKPAAVIDAVLAKRNLGTHTGLADVTIALGPGFCAGKDVSAVIETMRGHDLGRLILSGTAKANTGVPGEVGGKSAERILRAPAAGFLKSHRRIGDVVERGETVFSVNGEDVCAGFGGLVRGLLRDGSSVSKGMKSADIDPRRDVDWRTVSDKARCLGGAALEAYMYLRNRPVQQPDRLLI